MDNIIEFTNPLTDPTFAQASQIAANNDPATLAREFDAEITQAKAAQAANTKAEAITTPEMSGGKTEAELLDGKIDDPNFVSTNSYQMLWLKENGDVGHSAFATDVYEKKTITKWKSGRFVQEEKTVDTGKAQVMELWPAGTVDSNNARTDVQADYNVGKLIDRSDLLNYQGAEKRAADGVLQVDTGNTTQEKSEVAKKVTSEMQLRRQSYPKYNGEKNNCADYTASGLEQSGITIGDKDTVTANWGIIGMSAKVRTPNKLWRDTVTQPNVQILKDPGSRVNEKYDFKLNK
jgi:hypothetical protein